MKGNIKKLALVVIMSVVPMLIAVVSAAAGPTYITGEYAGTATAQCLIAPKGFSANLTPNPMPNGTVSAVVNTLVWEIAYKFNRDGTGSVTGVDHYNILPNPALNISPSAGSANVSWDFTYTVTAAGDITFALAKGSFQCSTYVSGPQQGTTSCVDGISTDGVISKDGKTITVTCGPPVLLDAVDSNGNLLGPQLSCTYSSVLVKQ
jgi:hypothetical protein